MAYSACPAPAISEQQQNAATTLSTGSKIARFVSSNFARAVALLSDRLARLNEISELRKQRRMLLNLTDRELADIGLTRADAEEEYRQSFKLL